MACCCGGQLCTCNIPGEIQVRLSNATTTESDLLDMVGDYTLTLVSAVVVNNRVTYRIDLTGDRYIEVEFICIGVNTDIFFNKRYQYRSFIKPAGNLVSGTSPILADAIDGPCFRYSAWASGNTARSITIEKL